ncbi:MAG: IS630 family transposase, partial [Chloroflexota bacterium]
VSAWENSRNNVKVQIDWQFKTDDARIKLKRLYPILKQQYSG